MITLIALINTTALIILIKRGLPRPFPWLASAFLGWILFLSAITSPFGDIQRAVTFVTLLSSIVITKHYLPRFTRYEIEPVFFCISIALLAFLADDAFRLMNTPDVSMTSGETFTYIRRPYLLEHPNVKASWLLLLSLSPLTLIGIFLTQSRGALLGYIVALFRFIPKRFYVLALIAASTLMISAAFVRPGSFFGRTDIWSDALTMFLASPIIGHGTGSYFDVTASGLATAHNAALTIAAENGMIGLIAFVAWAYAITTQVMRSTDPFRFNLLAFTVQQVVDDQWLHPVNAILLGIVMSVCIFQSEDSWTVK